jgi:hypothetical protein
MPFKLDAWEFNLAPSIFQSQLATLGAIDFIKETLKLQNSFCVIG